MDMEIAARVLAGSILTMLALVVVVVGIIVINNIMHHYWKPIRIFTADSWNFNPPEEYYQKVSPKLDETIKSP